MQYWGLAKGLIPCKCGLYTVWSPGPSPGLTQGARCIRVQRFSACNGCVMGQKYFHGGLLLSLQYPPIKSTMV